jgi:hypothetical protein
MNKEFVLPVRGVNYGFPVDKTPPAYSGYMDNVRPRDTLENRIRLGQRPGLEKAYSQQIGGASSPIKKSFSISQAKTSDATLYENYITGDNTSSTTYGANWRSQTFLTTSEHVVTSVQLKLYKVSSPGTITVGIRATSGGEPTGSDLTSGTYPGNSLGATPGAFVEIDMPSYTLSNATTYAIVVRATSGDVSNQLQWRYDAGDGAYADGAAYSSNNSGSTWSLISDPSDFMFKIYGRVPNPQTTQKKLVAVSNNEVWYETSAGTMGELSAANNDIDTSDSIDAFEGFQKGFFINNDRLKVFDLVNTDTFSSGETVTGTDDDSNAISFTTSAAETAPPHWYDYTVFGTDSSFGVMPDQATIGCLYRGRVVLAGDIDYPHQWYMAKVGQPFNYVYDSTDPLTAVRGGNADAGEIGDIITALIPYKDDYLIIGCGSSVWMMLGDPASGGSLAELSLITGIWGQKAWCFDDKNNLYFFGLNGIYKTTVQAGSITPPQNISSIVLPNLVSDWDLDDSLHEVTLGYDPIRNGILITKTIISTGACVGYWHDLKTEGFYPETYASTDCGVFSSFYYNATDSTYRKHIVGCNDGYLRYFLDTKKDDETGTSDTTISSYMTLPIQQLSEDFDKFGKLVTLTVELAGGASGGDFSDTDGVSWELHKGNDAETVLEDIRDGATAFTSGTLSGTGRKNKLRPRMRGVWMGLKFYNSTASETWAVNKVFGTILPAGYVR